MTKSRVRALLASSAVAGLLLAGMVMPANAISLAPMFTISANSGATGLQITVSGDLCVTGDYVHVFVYQGVVGVPVGGRPTANLIVPVVHNPINPASWSFPFTIPAAAQPGTITFVASCAPAATPEAGTPTFWYNQAIPFTVTGDPVSTTTTAGPTTTTAAKTTTTAAAVAAKAVGVTPTFTG